MLRLLSRFLAGAVLGAVFFVAPTRADYTLDLTISDNQGHSITIPVSGPFSGPGSISFSDAGTTFKEFTSLNVNVTSQQSTSLSFLNDTQITGTLAKGQSGVNLSVVLTGANFTSPSPTVNAFDTLSSSTTAGFGKPASFSSANVDAVFSPGGDVGLLSAGPPPYSSTGPTAMGLAVGSSGYTVTQTVNILGITAAGLSSGAINNTATTTWTPAVPLPGGLTMGLLGSVAFLAVAWIRRRTLAVG
jgi:hypothetical protein